MIYKKMKTRKASHRDRVRSRMPVAKTDAENTMLAMMKLGIS
jgi:hypothetical protein